ncbi:MAG: ParB/RepB/Spo0J family partition protein [Desulfomonilaceae bacterium]
MNTKTVNLSLKRIDLTNRDFHILCFDSLDSLSASIVEIGLLNPPVVKQTAADNFVPVLGRRRLEVLTQLKTENVEVRVIGFSRPDDQTFLMAFWDNLDRIKRDVAVKACAVKRLMELIPVEAMAQKVLPFIDVPAQGPKIERLRRIGCLEMPVLEALSNGKVNEKCVLILSRLSLEERLSLLKLISDLALNSNKAFEVISRLFDISICWREPITGLLARPEVLKILDDSNIALAEKAFEFRKLLQRWAFPDLVHYQQNFQNWTQELDLPKEVILRPAQSFEDDSITAEIRLSSRARTGILLDLIRPFLLEDQKGKQ